MKTAFILLAQYDGLAVIPLDVVCRDYFRYLSVEMLLRKVMAGEIACQSRAWKAARKPRREVHIAHLAEYLDRRAEAARKECKRAG